MSEWRPIAAAPRDGELRLFYSPAAGVFIGPDIERPAFLHNVPDETWMPTHWMPLPEPPND